MKFKWYEVAYIVIFSLSIFSYSALRPYYSGNGDLFTYVAATYKAQGFNKQEIYEKTDNDLTKSIVFLE